MLALVTTKHKVLEVEIFNFKLIYVYSRRPQSLRFFWSRGRRNGKELLRKFKTSSTGDENRIYVQKQSKLKLLGKLTENQYQRHLLIMYIIISLV